MFSERLSGQLLRHRWLLLLLSLVLVAFAVGGFSRFTFNASVKAFFADDYPYFDDFEAMESRYGTDSRIFFMIEPVDGDVFQPQVLAFIEQLTAEAWQLDHSIRVDSLANFQHSRSVDDDMYVNALVEQAGTLDEQALAYVREVALGDPALVDRLVTADGRYAAMVVNFAIDGKHQHEYEFALAEKVYDWVERLEQQNPFVRIYVTGDIISNYNNGQILQGDLLRMVPLMFALMFVLLGLLLRTLSGVIVCYVIAILAMLAGMGLSSWLGITFSMMSMNAVMITITVTMAHCVHILGHFLHMYRKQDKRTALADSLHVNFLPVTITSFTTALGFVTLNFGDMPPAAALGNSASVGVLMSWLFSLTVLPALVMLLPFRKPQGESGLIESWMLRYAGWIIRHTRLVLVLTAVYAVLMTVLALQNTVNDRFSEMIKEPHPFRSDNAMIDRHFGGLYNMNFDVAAERPGGITQVDYLTHLDKMTGWLREQPEINSVFSFVDVIKRLNKSMHGDDPAFYAIPDSDELAAQLLLLYEMSLPFGQDLTNQISMDKSASRLMITTASLDTHETLALQQKIIAWQQSNLPSYMRDDGASLSIMWSHLGIDALVSSVEGSFIALLVISLVMITVLRSFRYGLLSLVPNVLPAVIGLGVWALINGEMGMGLMSVIIITIGIVVDDTVHFLTKYQYARTRFAHDTEQAIRYAFRHVGTAICITTAVLATGFALLVLSDMTSNSDFGLLTTIILLAALALDFFLLPALLLWLDKKPLPAAAVPVHKR